MERLGYSGFQYWITFYNGLIHTGPSADVVALHCQEFLQCMSSAVSLQSPHFHFTKPLAAELGLASKRQLCYERVWSDRPGVYLVGDKVMQFQHIHASNRNRPLERLPCLPVVQRYLSAGGQAGFFQKVLDLAFFGPFKNGRRDMEVECPGCPAQMNFKYLSHVHSRR